MVHNLLADRVAPEHLYSGRIPQILPTGDITGTAGYLVAWAEKRVEMLGRMVDNQNRT